MTVLSEEHFCFALLDDVAHLQILSLIFEVPQGILIHITGILTTIKVLKIRHSLSLLIKVFISIICAALFGGQSLSGLGSHVAR